MIKNLMMGTAALALSMGMTGAANALIIDDFIDAPQFIELFGPEPAALPNQVATALDNAATAGGLPGASASSILGGYRDLTTTLVFSSSSSLSTQSEVITGLGLGQFSHTQESGVKSNSYLTWDGLAGAGLGSVDLTEGGSSDKFHLVVLEADSTADWSLELFDGDSDYLYVFNNPSDVDSTTGPLDLYLDFSIFTAMGIDMTDINKIIFGANVGNGASFDTSVALFETYGIPEPASMTLLGAGLMGLGYMGRRRKA